MSKIVTHLFFQIPFLAGRKSELRDFVIRLADQPNGSSVILCNAHVVVEAERDPALKKALSRATAILPDGTPIAWMLRAKGLVAERYSGPDLMTDVFQTNQIHKHFFLGSTPEVLEKMKLKFKGKIAGTFSPPFKTEFSNEEISKHIKIIKESEAKFIWVGLGAPKQEKYVIEMAKKAGFGVWLAVGAAFDFYAGTKPRAPEWLQTLGLEWAFRMASEPRRLIPRYLKTNPKFIQLAIAELLGEKFRNGRSHDH